MTEKPNVPRTFLTPAYCVELERGTFGLFRHVEIEDPETRVREKFGERIGPIWLLREAKIGEEADFITSRPDGTVIQLVKFYEDHGKGADLGFLRELLPPKTKA